VAGDDRKLWLGELPVDDMQVGSADPTGADPQENLARARRRYGDVFEAQARARLLQDHGPCARKVSRHAGMSVRNPGEQWRGLKRCISCGTAESAVQDYPAARAAVVL
jgi:hypothetical protein